MSEYKRTRRYRKRQVAPHDSEDSESERGPPSEAVGSLPEGILLLVEDDELAEHLQDLMETDATLRGRHHRVDITSAPATWSGKPRILVAEASAVEQLMPQLAQLDSVWPLVVIFDQLSMDTIRRIFDSYLHVKGIFSKQGLMQNLWQLGQFARVLADELNLLGKEQDQYQAIGSLLPLADRTAGARDYISLLVDPEMRRFLTHLAVILKRLRAAPLRELRTSFWERHRLHLDPLFASIGKLLTDEKLSGPIMEHLDGDLRPTFDELTSGTETSAHLAPIHILLRGETGTGKTLVARWIARYLGLDEMQHINVSSLPQALIESELFGSLKGAFTGAVSRPGALLRAYGGAIFLDEIGDLPPETQGKLLVYLDNCSFRPLGWSFDRSITAPCHVIAATNRPLGQMMAQGTFRRDLYHRFTHELTLPSLRDRKSDLPLLVEMVLQDDRVDPRRQVQGISYRALNILGTYPLRGNFRELEDLLGRAVGAAIRENEAVILEKHIYRAMLETASSAD